MTDLWSWPGLGARPRTQSLRCNRAAWGKQDNSGFDFRWLGASPGFTSERSRLRAIFDPTGQELPRFPMWWHLGNRWYAAWSYQGKGLDRSRRPWMETQILEWEGAAGVPPALAALAMLPAVSNLNDDLWARKAHHPEWQSERFEVRLDGVDLPLSEAALAETVDTGLVELSDVPPPVLRNFYEALVAAEFPAIIPDLKAPLSPAALAVLLLPATPAEASSWSLTGWPNGRTEWSAIAQPAAHMSPLRSPTRAQADRAVAMTAALERGSPQTAAGPQPAVRKVLDEFARQMSERWLEPEPAHPLRLNDLESKLLEAEVISLETAALPPYLESLSRDVKDAFRRQMKAKAAMLVAWWIAVSEDENHPAWVRDRRGTERDLIDRILSRWRDTAVLKRRPHLRPQSVASTASSKP